MTTISNNLPVQRSADDFNVMYEHIRYRAPMEGNDDHANANGWSDVTPPSSPSTASTHSTFDGLQDEPLDGSLHESDYDQISDREELEQDRLISIRDPTTIRRLAMAADFSEGRLDTTVGSPQIENKGTPTQYVSYLITTKVGTWSCSFTL
jgi:sorting nexin-4